MKILNLTAARDKRRSQVLSPEQDLRLRLEIQEYHAAVESLSLLPPNRAIQAIQTAMAHHGIKVGDIRSKQEF